ncbi:MAG: hypothetical protein ABIN91_11265 [Mucilaginibacter sp.]|uniref:hypothetical protein n=1 Tax=Mucilaginibacter sp. TaxID=1882438 RepID=UPI0032643F5B
MSFLKYAEGGFNEWDVKWKLSWSNFMLYMSSIPRYDSEDNKKPEVKDSDDIF